MDSYFIGIIGATILVIGSAWPDRKTSHPAKSIKNLLFALGNVTMISYSYLNFINEGASVFFILLQLLIAIATVLMLLNTDDRLDTAIMTIAATALITWSLHLYRGTDTIIFVAGMALLGLGYALQPARSIRNTILCLGSSFVAWFSYLEADWVFFWLNIFFAAFSAYYAVKLYFGSRNAK